MKHNLSLAQLLSILLLSTFVFQSCLKDECQETRTFVQVDPVYLAEEEIRVAPKFVATRELVNTGKIYVYQDYLMINEIREGIHIFDNADPKNPENLGFISIPGNVDIAIDDDILYADNYMDLLSIDISDIKNPQITCRDVEVFGQFWYDQSREAFLVQWRETDRTMELECGDPNFGNGFFNRGGEVFIDVVSNESADAGGASGSSTGTGGSLARFSIAQNHLYAIDRWQLHVFDLEEKAKPVRLESENVGFGIETTFAYLDHLFIGANDGLYIYSIISPGNPRFVSNFTHARACDPVFVQDDVAYVTLRNGSVCESFTNQLDVLDISNLSNPTLIKSHDMENPHGLSVRDNHLFICEGIKGLKSFDISDLEDIPSNKLDHIKDFYAVDVISLAHDHLIVVGPDGLFQYSVDTNGDMKEMSTINTSK